MSTSLCSAFPSLPYTSSSITSSLPKHQLTTSSPSLLLTYLIPTHLHTTLSLPRLSSAPSSLQTLSLNQKTTSSPFSPSLRHLFSPLTHAILTGSLQLFSTAMETNEAAFVKRRIYLSLERSRGLCLRNLLRRVWLLENLDSDARNTRVKVGVFARGVRFSMGEEGMDDDEVECLVAGLIYKVCCLPSDLKVWSKGPGCLGKTHQKRVTNSNTADYRVSSKVTYPGKPRQSCSARKATPFLAQASEQPHHLWYTP